MQYVQKIYFVTRRSELQIVVNAVILGLWLWIYRSVFGYLAVIFSREDFRVNQILLAGVILLIALQWRRGEWHIRPARPPQAYRPALILMLGGSLLYLAAERFLDIHTLSAALFGLAGYGLLGLWLPPARWKSGIPAALLLIGTLPFGDHLQTFVGYPLRLLTADLVRHGLHIAGAPSLEVDTVLLLENGVAKIDLPCSGVKSLWTGLLFLFAATWIERHPFNFRWLLTAALMALLIFGTNVLRIAILVLVGIVLDTPVLAQMLHVPLGMLLFAGTCAVPGWLLRRHAPPALPAADRPAGPQPAWLQPALAAGFLGLGLLYTPHPTAGLTQPPPWSFPPEIVTEPLPLQPDQIEWFTRGGAESADRRRFTWRGLSGSLILVTSTTWRAQHQPERCFEVNGLQLERSFTLMVAPDFPVRFVALGDHEGAQSHSATYWFQSPDQITDDYATRIWADLAPQRPRWVLVTILFDRVQSPQSPELHEFYNQLRTAIAQSITKGE